MTAPNIHLHERLRVLAQNLWWTWHPEVISIFTDLDPHLWRQVDHNPIGRLPGPNGLPTRVTFRQR